MHESSNEFEIRSDPTAGFYSNKLGYDGKTVSPLILDCFSSVPFSYLQVTMACMRAWTSSNFGLIGPPTAELAALERMKKSP